VVYDGCTNDDTVGDSYGDTCTDYYDANPDTCGTYDTDTFVAADLCCACVGLAEDVAVEETEDVAVEEAEDVAVEEPEEVPTEDPIPDATAPEAVDNEDTSAVCVNDDSVGDSYGDTCTDWYLSRPETCGDYDTDEFTAATMCCICQWDDLATQATEFEANQQYLVDLLADNFAVFFTVNNCDYCHYAQNYMNSIGYPSYIVDLDDLENQEEVTQFLRQFAENSMVPALLIDG